MKLTVVAPDDNLVGLEVEADEQVENVKAILEAETGMPLAEQELLFNGQPLQDNAQLHAVGIKEEDVLMLLPKRRPAAAPAPAANALAMNADGSAVNPAAFLQHVLQNPQQLSQMTQMLPDLGRAISAGSTDALQTALRRVRELQLETQRQRQAEAELGMADPFDPDVQRRIEEAIAQKNIEENWAHAIEYNPEAFARVVMLYVDAEVNGKAVKAFVDSGAQMTIMSQNCAERCGLFRLLDKRYSGIARGVGQSKILGRVHAANLKIGGQFFSCSITVLEQNDVEFIFGLDMLRKHQCSIDLKDNVLRVGAGEIMVPFLAEKDIPAHLRGIEGLSGVDALPEELPSGSGSGPSGRQPVPSSTTVDPSRSGGVGVPPSNQGAQEEKVKKLTALGFTVEQAQQALDACGGDEETAASLLFGGM